MWLEILPWVLSGVGIVGAILNIMKRKSCFVIWTVGNMFWIWLGIVSPAYQAQIPLWVTFNICNVIGWLKWRSDEILDDEDDLMEER